MPVSAARAAAFDILLRVERNRSFASELLHSGTHKRLSTPDHALATELVMGVLRWRSSLDDDIAGSSSQALSKLDLEVLITLRLGVYQFRFLDRIPQRATIYESVEMVKRARKSSAAGFVNAVLRKLSMVPLRRVPEVAEHGISLEKLAELYAHPPWLVERWAREYGPSIAHKICERNQAVPTTTIRLRSSTIEQELSEQSRLTPGSLLSSARHVHSSEVTNTDDFLKQHFVIQDEGSQLVVALVGRGSRLLDCCAAPGGKTLGMADANPQAFVTAVEIHAHRTRLLKTLTQHGSASARIRLLVADARQLPISAKFDRILADVPCSGTGTLARNPEIKWTLRFEDLAELQARQIAILSSALQHLDIGGRLVYSTCSLEREENEDVVEELLRQSPGLRLLDCGCELNRLRSDGTLTWSGEPPLARGPYLRTIPGVHPCDGFFAAILEKN